MEYRCCAKGKEVMDSRSVMLHSENRQCGVDESGAASLQFTRSASPFFFGGVSSKGRVSMNLTNSLHSFAEKMF